MITHPRGSAWKWAGHHPLVGHDFIVPGTLQTFCVGHDSIVLCGARFHRARHVANVPHANTQPH